VDWYGLGVLLYEFLVGVPPYFDQDREQLYTNIKSGPLKMPKFLSPEAIDLINSLLDRHPMKRLGAGPNGAQDIKNHPFFDAIDWEDVYMKRTFPPVRKRKAVKPKEISIEEFLDPENINIL
jgi:serine/threonine protein kinase